MKETHKASSDDAQVDSTEGDVGDLEMAGETTAAVMINGDTTDICRAPAISKSPTSPSVEST